MGQPGIYLWIRATTDWQDEQAFRAQLDPALEPAIDAWNDTFNIPFHLFRHRVRQIAESNLAQIEGCVRAEWEDIPDGALVVPADDDDWFAPELARVLESEFDPDSLGCYWTSGFIEVPLDFRHRLALLRRRLFPATPPRYVFSTNNYALVKREGAQALLRLHVTATRWFEARGGEGVRKIGRPLSVMNRTLASRGSLAGGKPTITGSQLIRRYRHYARLYRSIELPDLAWCRPYVAMMADLMDELAVTRKTIPARVRAAGL